MTSYSSLIEQRNWLESGLTTAYREADKLIVSVSSAVLALSVAFIGQIRNPENTQLMKFSWALFVGAIAAVLISLIFEQQERISRINRIDEAIKRSAFDFQDRRKIWGALSLTFNLASLAAFLSGLSALSLFLWSNLG